MLSKLWKLILNFLNFKIETVQNIETVSKNPYKLVWYKHNWSNQKVRKNNTKYWKWEFENS